MRNFLKYGVRFLGGFILILLLVVLLISLLIQLQPVKNKIAGFAENQVSKFINGELSIGRLNGNFFTDLSLENVLLTADNDTLIYIANVDVRYNLLSLFEGMVDIHTAIINKPYIILEQINDSLWNVQNLVDTVEEESDTTKTGSIKINLSEFRINQGQIKINSQDSVIPEQINNLNTKLSLFWSDEKQSVKINNFSLSTVKPDFQLNQLTFLFNMNEEQAELIDFIVSTGQNYIEGQAVYRMKPVQTGSANFKINELHLNEFSYFLPDISINATPEIIISGEMIQDSVAIEMNLKDSDQVINANILTGNLIKYFFRDSTIVPDYMLETEFRNIQPGYWTGNPEIDYLINGNLNARGYGIEPASANIILEANLHESKIENQTFNSVSANLELRAGNLSGTIKGDGEFGQFYLAPRISDLMGNPSYNLILNANELNLSALTGTDTLESNINLRAQVEGRSFDPDQIVADGSVIIFNSSFQQLELDSLLAQIHYSNNNIRIDSLWLRTEYVTAKASGNYSLDSNSDLNLSINFEGLQEFENFIPVKELSTRGVLEANISGVADSLVLEAIIRLDSTQYDTITFESLLLHANGKVTPTDTLFDATAYVYSLNLGGFLLDSVSASVNGSPDSVFLQTTIVNQDLQTQLHAGIVPAEKLKITIPLWEIAYKEQKLFLQHPPAYIELDSVNYLIENFRLATGPSDSAQFLSLEGLISRKGQEDFILEAGNIDIIQLAGLFDTDLNGTGLADIYLNLSGHSESPILNGNFEIRDAEINEYRFADLKGKMNYNNNILAFESVIIPQDSGRFEIKTMLPIQLNLDTMGFHFSPDDSLSAQLLIEEFSLSVLNSFNIPVQTTGFIEGKVNVTGTAKAPDPEGNIRLVNASFTMREFGIDYRDVKMNLNFMRDLIELDTFRIRTSDGDVKGNGTINFGSDFYKGDITDSKIQLNFNRFNPVNHRQFNMQVEGSAELKGQGEEVVFGGDLRIPQAEFYLPAIFRLMGRMGTKEIPKPILVQELDKMPEQLDSIKIMTFIKEEPDSASFDYFDQLKGQLRVQIPRNTWIKNDDMRIEISGELEVIKNLDFFELFGQVEVVRGQYELLGKVFVIDEGTVNFEGGKEMNFRMNISASYSFRNNQQVQQELTVNLSGTPEEPEVNFELNGNAIDEGDALSYILFGKSMNELTMNEQDNMERAGVGNLAEQAAASLVSAQLTSFLQDKLDVDYIEVKSGSGFDEASVVVGKYITNKLFVSYEQRFGQSDEQNLKKYEVKLEYELFRFLFFELNNSTIDSGFDVIFKFDVL